MQAMKFVQQNAEEILRSKLKNNCKLHLFSLHSLGFLKARECEEICVLLNEEEKRLQALGRL